MAPVTVIFNNDGRTAWKGYLEHSILRFDFETNEGKAIRFFALPDKCVMFVHRPWPDSISRPVEWVVHLADVFERDREHGVWEIVDREIDVIVEENLQTYRVIDLEDFGAALEEGQISPHDARRLLRACQQFLDEYLHGGGKFPPQELRRWLGDLPQPQRVALNTG